MLCSSMTSTISSSRGAGLLISSSTTMLSLRTSLRGGELLGGGTGLRCLLTSMTSLLETDRREGARRGDRERRRITSSSNTVVLLRLPPALKAV